MLKTEGSLVRAPQGQSHFLQLVFDFLSPQSHSPSVLPSPPPKLPKAKMPGKDKRVVDLLGQVIEYELLRRKRKTIGMHVSEGRLRVAAPKWVSLSQIHEALQEKGAWILKQIEHTQEKAKAAKAQDVRVVQGCVLPWLGSNLQVNFAMDSSAPKPLALNSRGEGVAHVGAKTLAQLVQRSFVERQVGEGAWARCSVQEAFELESARAPLTLQANAALTGSSPTPQGQAFYRLNLALPHLPQSVEASGELALQVLTAVLKAHAHACFEGRLSHFAARFGVAFKSFKLSAAKTRWGSASQSGLIHLNWHLVHFSPALMDYVVAHELCHLIHMNHSEQFWARLSQVMPDSELRRQILHRKTPPRLLSLDESLN